MPSCFPHEPRFPVLTPSKGNCAGCAALLRQPRRGTSTRHRGPVVKLPTLCLASLLGLQWIQNDASLSLIDSQHFREVMQRPSSNTAGIVLPSPSGAVAGRQPPTAQAWQAVKETVRRLYVEQELPLHQVKAYLERHHDFRASERMYKDRLKKWNFTKNLMREDWEALAVLHAYRKALGKRSTHFYVRGRKKTVRDLQKYSRSQGLTEDNLAASTGAGIEISDDYRAVTPKIEDVNHQNDLPSDASEKSSPSPDRLQPGKGHQTNTQVHGSSTVRRSTNRTSNFESTSPWSQGDFLFPLDSRDRIASATPGTNSFLSPTSSSSASLAFTRSTMDTSIGPEDATACRSNEYEPSWTNLDPDVLPSYTEEDSWSSDPISMPSSCENLTREVELMSCQLTNPGPLRSRHGAEDISAWMMLQLPAEDEDPNQVVLLCSVCNQPSASHFVSIHNTAPQEPPRSILNDAADDNFELPATTKEVGAWKWIAMCFASCLNLKKRNDELATKLLDEASTEFEGLVLRKDQMLLTAANQVITILHMHSQGRIAVRVMRSAKSVIDRMLPPEDPVRITINYLTLTANSSTTNAVLQENGIASDVLYVVYKQFDDDPTYGPLHPYTIAAFYNHCWLLRREGKDEEAEQKLLQVYATSCSIFGKNHMQSITALATIAGTQVGQKKSIEAIENYRRVVRDCKPTLGKRHPYRLECKRRLAIEYEARGQRERMMPLYWDVLAGRVYMLGRTHEYTLAAKRDYEELMRELGRWDCTAQREVEALFKNAAAGEITRRGRSGSNSSHESECLAF